MENIDKFIQDLRKSNPKGAGVLALGCCLFLLAINWFLIRYMDLTLSPVFLILCVALLPPSLMVVILPTRWLYEPTETDDRLESDQPHLKPTIPARALMVFLIVLGAIAGFVGYPYLQNGF